LGAYSFLAGYNKLKENSQVDGHVDSYGLVYGGNTLEKNSQVDGHGGNTLEKNSHVNGRLGAYSFLAGYNKLKENSRINGDVISKGIFVEGLSGRGFVSNSDIGLEDYTYTKPLKGGENGK